MRGDFEADVTAAPGVIASGGGVAAPFLLLAAVPAAPAFVVRRRFGAGGSITSGVNPQINASRASISI